MAPLFCQLDPGTLQKNAQENAEIGVSRNYRSGSVTSGCEFPAGRRRKIPHFSKKGAILLLTDWLVGRPFRGMSRSPKAKARRSPRPCKRRDQTGSHREIMKVTDSTPAPAAQAAPRVHPSAFDKLMWVGELQARKDLTPAARRIVVRLAYHHNSTTGRCDPSIKALAEGSGLAVRMTNKALAELKAAGIIDWIPGNETTRNKYTLRDVPLWDYQSKAAPAPAKRGKGPASSSGATVIPFPGPVESGQSDPGGSAPQCTRVVHSSTPGVVHSSASEPSNSNLPREPVSSEAPGGGSGKQTASGSQKGQKGQKGQYTTFPADFTLTDDRIKVATSRGVKTQDVKEAFAHFREHHLAKGTRSPNWPMSWAAWCRVHTRQRKVSEPKQSAV